MLQFRTRNSSILLANGAITILNLRHPDMSIGLEFPYRDFSYLCGKVNCGLQGDKALNCVVGRCYHSFDLVLIRNCSIAGCALLIEFNREESLHHLKTNQSEILTIFSDLRLIQFTDYNHSKISFLTAAFL